MNKNMLVAGRIAGTAFAFAVVLLFAHDLAAIELLSDPGFEEANPDSATFGWRRHEGTPAGGVAVIGEGAHGGKKYVQLRIPSGKTEAAVYQPLRLPDLKKTFVLSVWARGTGELLMYCYQSGVENVGGAFNSTDLAQLKMGEQKIIYLPSLCRKVRLSPEWKPYDFVFTPDPKASSISAAFHVWEGTADIDDASLVVQGEKADEDMLPLRFASLQGCFFDNGTLRPAVRAVQRPGEKHVVMEAEHATALSLDPRGGIRQDARASCMQAIDFANSMTFKFELAEGGTYQAWYRANIPFAASWSHAESVDGDERNNQDAAPNDGWKADTWAWRPGPVYKLAAGEHTWIFNNWHGGIRLDQAALLISGEKPPADDTVLPASTLKPMAEMVAISSPLKPHGLKSWRRLVFARNSEKPPAAVESSSDGGRTWNPVPDGGDIASFSPEDELRFRFRLLASPTPAPLRSSDLASISNPSAVYVPGAASDFIVRGPCASFRITGLSAQLGGLKDARTGMTFDMPGGQGQPLFIITERKLNGTGRLETLSSLDGQLHDARVVKAGGAGEKFTFSYSMLDGMILVDGELEAGDTDLIRGRLHVRYAGEDEIVAVDFPILSNLSVGGDAKDDILIVPFTQGWKIPNPASQSFAYPRYWTWPGMLSMGYVDLYDKGKNAGLYLSSYDNSFTTTQFMFKGSSDGAVLGMGLRKWIRLRKGQNYDAPDAVIGLHSGDWHWAADRYREWADSWFRKGNTPRWFRESDGYVSGGPLWQGPFDQNLVSSAEKCAANGCGLVATWGYMATMNGACGVYPFPSPWYGGTDNLRWSNRKIHELGAHSNYYIQGHLFNPGYNRENKFLGNLPRKYIPEKDWKELPDKDFFRRVRVIEPDGSASTPYLHAEMMCDSGKMEFNRYLGDWTLKFLRDYDADGIYFDGFAIGSALPSINYDDDHATTGDWGRGQLRMIRRCKEEGREINPDLVIGMEGCSDVYQQFGDWGLMGNNNALEMFRYTFPDLIVVGGSSNGKPEVAVENVFMNAYRMNEMLHDADKDKTQAGGIAGKHYDFLRPWAGRVAAIRKIVNPFLLRARFMDTVGVRADADVDARLMLRGDDNNKGALVLVHNVKEAGGKKVSVSTGGWGPVRAAWRVTWQGVSRLEGENRGGNWEFEIPADKYSAALLVNESEPLIEKRMLPLGLPKGTAVSGEATVLNINPDPLELAMRVTGPSGFGGEPVEVKAEPGVPTTVKLNCSAGADAKVGERVDLLLEAEWNRGWFSSKKTDWLLPARIVGPLDARLRRSGEKEMVLSLRNRTGSPLSGQFKIAMEQSKEIGFEPLSAGFSVPPSGISEIKIKADLGKLETFESAVAKLAFDGGGHEEAYACVGPFVMNSDFESSNFGLLLPLADGGWEYDGLFAQEGGRYDKLERAPRIVFDGAYRGRGCLLVPKGGRTHITWNAWLPPNKKYKVRIAIKRTTPEAGGFSMSMAGDICSAPWLGNTKTPRLNEWELFEGEFRTLDASPHWQVCFHNSPTGDVCYDALDIEEIP